MPVELLAALTILVTHPGVGWVRRVVSVPLPRASHDPGWPDVYLTGFCWNG